MKKEQTPLVMILVAVILVAAGIIYWQSRPSGTSDQAQTPAVDRPPAGDEPAKAYPPTR